ncbi:MAG: hypothetical protein HY590_01935 [Candidatus Omnitrophica bacterium]|nr:hypothetical protein [Candidatus Omnitrophota bacterium]
MRKTIIALLLGAGLIFLPQTVFSEKTKKELQEEKMKEAKEAAEKEKKAKEALEAEMQHRKIIDLQKTIRDQQQALQDTLERTRFPLAQFTIDKKEYAPKEAIVPKFTLRNGSRKAFWIDGRLATPVYEIRDKRGKVVFASKRPNYTLPLKKDLMKLGPGQSIQFPKVEGIHVDKPGSYLIRGSYVFFAPVEEDELKDLWTGTITTYPVSFTVPPEKSS